MYLQESTAVPRKSFFSNIDYSWIYPPNTCHRMLIWHLKWEVASETHCVLDLDVEEERWVVEAYCEDIQLDWHSPLNMHHFDWHPNRTQHGCVCLHFFLLLFNIAPTSAHISWKNVHWCVLCLNKPLCMQSPFGWWRFYGSLQQTFL